MPDDLVAITPSTTLPIPPNITITKENRNQSTLLLNGWDDAGRFVSLQVKAILCPAQEAAEVHAQHGEWDGPPIQDAQTYLQLGWECPGVATPPPAAEGGA